MRLGKAVMMMGGGVVALAVAQGVQESKLVSRKGDFAIENIRHEVFTGDAATGLLEFEFSGDPLRGRSGAQALTFTAQKAVGQAKTLSGGGMYLVHATLSGGVLLWQNRGAEGERQVKASSVTLKESQDRGSLGLTVPGQLVFSGGGDTLQAGSGSFEFVGSSGNRELRSARLSGGVTGSTVRGGDRHELSSASVAVSMAGALTRFTFGGALKSLHSTRANDSSRTVDFSAASGWIETPNILKPVPKGVRPVSGADLAGPVTVTVRSVKVGDGEPLNMTATGDHLTMTPAGEVRLVGNISVKTDDLEYTKTGSAQVLYIVLNENMEVVKYGSTGSPAKLEVRPTGSGGK